MSETRSRIAPGITMPSFAPSVPSFPSGGVSVPSLRAPEDYGPSSNPFAAVQSAVQARRGIQQLQQGQITLRQAQQADVNRWLVPLLQNPNATEADVAKYLGIARANGANVGAALDEYRASGMTPTQWVQSRVTSAGGLTPAERVQYVTPGVGPQVAGAGPGGMPGTYTTTTGAPISAAPGVTQPQAFVPSGLSAAQAAQELRYQDPSTGRNVQTTVGAYAAKYGMRALAFPQTGWIGNIGFAPNAPGNPQLVGGGGGGPAAPSAAPSAPTAPTGGGTAATGGQSQPAFGPAQPGGPQPRLQPTGATAAPGGAAGGLGGTEVQSPAPAARVQASEEAWNADLRADQGYTQRTFPLYQISGILDRDPNLTGSGAGLVNDLKAALVSWVPDLAGNAEFKTASDFQELRKYMAMAVMANKFAGRSDMALGETLSGTPNTGLLGLSNQNLIRAMIGLERMQHTAVTEFAKNPTYGGWNEYSRNWQNTVDPRAFVADMLAPEQQQALAKDMDGTTPAKLAERRRFQQTLQIMQNNPDLLRQQAMPQ